MQRQCREGKRPPLYVCREERDGPRWSARCGAEAKAQHRSSRATPLAGRLPVRSSAHPPVHRTWHSLSRDVQTPLCAHRHRLNLIVVGVGVNVRSPNRTIVPIRLRLSRNRPVLPRPAREDHLGVADPVLNRRDVRKVAWRAGCQVCVLCCRDGAWGFVGGCQHCGVG